tara:strand:- start:76075 stop:79623 length:3549 start_codon:yes stop_codon:yes gene_type:complete
MSRRGAHQGSDKAYGSSTDAIQIPQKTNSLGGLNRSAFSRETNSISSMASRNNQKEQNPILDNQSIFAQYNGEIRTAFVRYSLVGRGRIQARSYELEVLLLNFDSKINHFKYWMRTLRFLRIVFPNVTPVNFSQYSQKIEIPDIDPQKYHMNKLTRIYDDESIANQTYIKIKHTNSSDPLKPLPMLTGLKPKLNMSLEINDVSNAEYIAVKDDTPVDMTRTRWSFEIDNTFTKEFLRQSPIKIPTTELSDSEPVKIRIDVTQNITSDGVNDNRSAYEIEIELLDASNENITSSHLNILDQWTKILNAVINMDGQYIQVQARKQLVKEFNSLFYTDPYPYFVATMANKPTDLKQKDFSWDSVRVPQPLFSRKGGFYISLKADGSRFFLYFSNRGIYLVNVFINLMTKIGMLTPNTMHLNGTVLDVEVVNKFDIFGLAEGGKYQILAFDIISLNGKDVRPETYTNRHQLVEKFVEDFNDTPSKVFSYIEIHAKPIYWLPSPQFDNSYTAQEEFEANRKLASLWYSTVRKLISSNLNRDKKTFIPQKTGNIEWGIDGFIFTPADDGYDDGTEFTTRKGFKIIGSHVRKFKLNITIDFTVSNLDNNGFLTLNSLSGNGKKLIVFHIEDIINVPIPQEELIHFKGMVVECEWVWIEEGVKGTFKVVRVREDKIEPNTISRANSSFSSIIKPIPVEQFYEETMYVMRNYHNRTKEFEIDRLASIVGANCTLLDLGSGQGGDLGKWAKLKQVYAVEPDETNIREFITRNQKLHRVHAVNTENTIDGYNQAMQILSSREIKQKFNVYQDNSVKINLLNAAAQDTKKLLNVIPEQSADVITLFNILTFFWSTPEMLDGLFNTLTTFCKPNGYICVIAFDGQKYSETMQGQKEWVSNNMRITSNIDPDDERKIWIQLAGGIVRGQVEYLTDLDIFISLMRSRGFALDNSYYLDQELLLSDEEMLFSSMSKVMIFKNGCSVDKSELSEKLNKLHQMLITAKSIRALSPDEMPMKLVSNTMSSKGIERLYRFGSIGDGSCYIHSILRSFCISYKAQGNEDRRQFVRALRQELANNYTRQIHNAVGNGFFRESKSPDFQYTTVKKMLGDAGMSIGHELMGYIGDQLNVNVYMMRGDVDAQPYKFAFADTNVKPGRKNIVLFWINGNHYETIGQMISKDTVQFVFPNDHPVLSAWQ